ncbi:MAG: hypothetical protein KKF12_06090 [Proteobacteria bacterium]|nr:hypothetical protein [Desulfobacula sp.]MBU4130368.1 hypothetical protein [Pseudomonadota bacterium]
MKPFNSKPQVLTHIKIHVSSLDLEQKIDPSGRNLEVLKTAEKILQSVKNIWKPAAVYAWFGFQLTQTDTCGHLIQAPEKQVTFDFGDSIKFLTHARHSLVAVYTAGPALEHKSQKASQRGDLLTSYLLDLIGLIVLEKVGNHINLLAQKKALATKMGLGPFLSPGSVHGWKLEEQIKLCSLLPLEKINVKIQKNAVLSPFKTISCLIGLGPGYETARAGSFCQVCAKNADCKMKHTSARDEVDKNQPL